MTLSVNQLSTYHSLFAPYCIFFGSHVTLFWMASLTHLPQCPHNIYHIHDHSPPPKKNITQYTIGCHDLNNCKSCLPSYHPSMFVQYVNNLILVSVWAFFYQSLHKLKKESFIYNSQNLQP